MTLQLEEEWVPKTKLGKLVKEGKITSIEQIFQMNLKIKEYQIVDILLPNLKDELVDVNLVQRQTDAGEKNKFSATAVVGNMDGYVGVGQAKATEAGPAIRKAIQTAKLNIIPVRRGCGSWECTCGSPHSIPFKVQGKSGSTKVVLLPAPKGLGLAIGDAAKVVLRLAGIKDIWSKTYGETRTTHNFVKATYEALKQTLYVMTPSDW